MELAQVACVLASGPGASLCFPVVQQDGAGCGTDSRFLACFLSKRLQLYAWFHCTWLRNAAQLCGLALLQLVSCLGYKAYTLKYESS